MSTSDVRLTGLWFYPIKSCRGVELQHARVGPRGIEHDREWMVVRPDGTFITQRQVPQLAVIAPALEEADLRLDAPGMPAVRVPLAGGDEGETLDVVVWRDRCAALDQGAEVAGWLTEFLKTEVRLVRMARSHMRQVDLNFAQPGDQVSFVDGYPFLVTSESSLDDLNGRLAAPVPMNRFRPSLIIAGAPAFAEDTWHLITVGELTLRVAKPCARCVTTTVDQAIGRMDGQEPLRTLSDYRLRERGAMFGQNLIHDRLGVLHVGDSVEVIEAV